MPCVNKNNFFISWINVPYVKILYPFITFYKSASTVHLLIPETDCQFNTLNDSPVSLIFTIRLLAVNTETHACLCTVQPHTQDIQNRTGAQLIYQLMTVFLYLIFSILRHVQKDKKYFS